jgi:L-lactate dehydrogenase (cytochrome)/(S)-mandelate dehydrogenase
MRLNEVVNVDDVRRMAKRRLPRLAFDFIEGGCDDEWGIRANEEAFRSYRLMPRYLVDVSAVDTQVSAAGRTYAMPFGISPTGTAGLFKHGADEMLAAEAVAANVPFILSSLATASIEQLADAGSPNVWFQIYGTGDPALGEDMVRRAWDAGVRTLVYSVDVPVNPNRERNRRNGFGLPARLTLCNLLQGVSHPRWSWDYLSNGGLPYFGAWRKYVKDQDTALASAQLATQHFPAPRQTWDRLDALRRHWSGKLLVKGVLHPEDALRVIQCGGDGVIVSNHGGRQLDRAPAALEALAGVLSGVGGRTEVMLDGGVRRGSDIAIALALGAKFVFAGRPTIYGVAAAGRSGAWKVLQIFDSELRTVLAQIGCPRARDLGLDFVRRSQAGQLVAAVTP